MGENTSAILISTNIKALNPTRCWTNLVVLSPSAFASPIASPYAASNSVSETVIAAEPPSFSTHSNSVTPIVTLWQFHHNPKATNILSSEQVQPLLSVLQPVSSPALAPPLLIVQLSSPSSPPWDSERVAQAASIVPMTPSSKTVTRSPDQFLPPAEESPEVDPTTVADQANNITSQPNQTAIQAGNGDTSPPNVVFQPVETTTQPSNDAATSFKPVLQSGNEASQQPYRNKPIAGETVKIPSTITTETHYKSIPTILVPDAVTVMRTASETTWSASNIVSTIGLQTGSTNKGSNSHPIGGHPINGPGDHGNSNDTSGKGTADNYGDPGSKLRVGAIVGGTVGAIATVSLLILIVWIWRKKLLSYRRRSSITPLTGDSRTEKRARRNDRIERGIIESATMGAGRADVVEFLRKSVHSVSQTIFGKSQGVDMNRGNSQFLEAVAVDGSTNLDVNRPGLRRTVSNPNRSGDFRVGMNLNLEKIGEFSPFLDAHATPPNEKVTAIPSSARLSNPFSDVHMIPPPISLRTMPGRRLRGHQSLGSYRHFQSLSRIQETENSRPHSDIPTERKNKFRSDPFDLELGNRPIPPVDSLTALSKNFDMSRSSSRYSLGTMPEQSRLDSYISRPISGISFNEWARLGQDIRVAMMSRDDSSTLISEELRRFGEREIIYEDSDLPDIVVGEAL
ncbi:hypothetical protein PT974_04179 [Cladobotryum mycophilum]|uniref:Uncharacterized protein n=1 Tax=Cladobotryum mycophilum TaxID=491253 RepID=A0ABR0SVG7_9HYPO